MHDLGAAAAELAHVVDHVDDADLDRPTPCDGWVVRDLLVHLLGLTAHFTTVARHTAPVEVETVLPADWRERLGMRLDALVEAWREPEAWTGEGEAGGVRMTNAEFGIVALDEIVLHGWDLARALDVAYAPDAADITAISAFVAAFEHAGDEQRDGLFGPVVVIDAGEPVSDSDGRALLRSVSDDFARVLALSGRDPRTAALAA